MRYGCCADMEHYALLEAAGYDCIELSGKALAAMNEAQIEQARELIAAGKMFCCGLNAFLPGDIALLGPEYDRGRLAAYCEKTLSIAQRLGAKTVGIGSPQSRRVPEGFCGSKADEQFRDALQTIAAISARHAVTALLEPICALECNFLNTTAQALALLRELSIPNLFLLYDIYHSVQMGEAVSVIDSAAPWIRHVHISQSDRPGHRFLFRGGEDAYAGHIERLRKTGYDGIISVEALTGDIVAEAGDSLRLLRAACGAPDKEAL